MYVMQPHKYKAKKGFWDEDKKGSENDDSQNLFLKESDYNLQLIQII